MDILLENAKQNSLIRKKVEQEYDAIKKLQLEKKQNLEDSLQEKCLGKPLSDEQLGEIGKNMLMEYQKIKTLKKKDDDNSLYFINRKIFGKTIMKVEEYPRIKDEKTAEEILNICLEIINKLNILIHNIKIIKQEYGDYSDLLFNCDKSKYIFELRYSSNNFRSEKQLSVFNIKNKTTNEVIKTNYNLFKTENAKEFIQLLDTDNFITKKYQYIVNIPEMLTKEGWNVLHPEIAIKNQTWIEDPIVSIYYEINKGDINLVLIPKNDAIMVLPSIIEINKMHKESIAKRIKNPDEEHWKLDGLQQYSLTHLESYGISISFTSSKDYPMLLKAVDYMSRLKNQKIGYHENGNFYDIKYFDNLKKKLKKLYDVSEPFGDHKKHDFKGHDIYYEKNMYIGNINKAFDNSVELTEYPVEVYNILFTYVHNEDVCYLVIKSYNISTLEAKKLYLQKKEKAYEEINIDKKLFAIVKQSGSFLELFKNLDQFLDRLIEFNLSE